MWDQRTSRLLKILAFPEYNVDKSPAFAPNMSEINVLILSCYNL